MRRVLTAPLLFVFIFSVSMLMTSTTAAASSTSPPGSGQKSVLTPQVTGATGVIFNDGTQSWAPGVVGLLICLPDSAMATTNADSASEQFSSTVYATVSATAEGQNGFFIYNYNTAAASTGLAPDTTATFNGDVASAKARLEGNYQINTTLSTTSGVSPGSVFTNTGTWTPTATGSFITISSSYVDQFTGLGSKRTATTSNSMSYAGFVNKMNSITSAMSPPALEPSAAYSSLLMDVGPAANAAFTDTNGNAAGASFTVFSDLSPFLTE